MGNPTISNRSWIEKDALIGVIAPICEQLDVPYFSCRGYVSQSELWSAAMRFKEYLQDGLSPIILHFGDHDPSGKDMTRDITDRFDLFLDQAVSIKAVEIRRLALNKDQIEKYNPPPNPTKLTDSRAPDYIALYGDSSWELDALEPRVISDLIKIEIESILDDDAWQNIIKREAKEKSELQEIKDSYTDILEYLNTINNP